MNHQPPDNPARRHAFRNARVASSKNHENFLNDGNGVVGAWNSVIDAVKPWRHCGDETRARDACFAQPALARTGAMRLRPTASA
jgi:hypothetical protein